MADPVDNARELTGDDAIGLAHESGMSPMQSRVSFIAGVGDLIRFARLVRKGWEPSASVAIHAPREFVVNATVEGGA